MSDAADNQRGLRRLLRTKRNVEEARMIIDMLVHRLRDGGPTTPREEIRRRLEIASEKLNEVAPRSILREPGQTVMDVIGPKQ